MFKFVGIQEHGIPGSGMLIDLPLMTCEQMKKVTGVDPSGCVGMKYSPRAVFQHTDGSKLQVYMCYGQWRIGGFDDTYVDALQKYLESFF